MKTNTNSLPPNNLLQARKRAGLERKQVAFLLTRKTNNEISIYERGGYLPNLQTALKLEAIYRTPIRLLFQGLFEQCRREIGERRKKDNQLLPREEWFPTHAEKLTQEEFCFYAEILKTHVPSSMELELIQNHTVSLINISSDYKNDRLPFADKDQSNSSPA